MIPQVVRVVCKREVGNAVTGKVGEGWEWKRGTSFSAEHMRKQERVSNIQVHSRTTSSSSSSRSIFRGFHHFFWVASRSFSAYAVIASVRAMSRTSKLEENLGVLGSIEDLRRALRHVSDEKISELAVVRGCACKKDGARRFPPGRGAGLR